MRTTLLIACLAGLLSVARGGSPPAQSTPDRAYPSKPRRRLRPRPRALPPSVRPNAAELEAELADF